MLLPQNTISQALSNEMRADRQPQCYGSFDAFIKPASIQLVACLLVQYFVLQFILEA